MECTNQEVIKEKNLPGVKKNPNVKNTRKLYVMNVYIIN